MLIKGKKGSLQDVILVAVILMFFGIVVLFGFKVMDEFNTKIQANTDIPSNAKVASTTLTGYFPTIMNDMFLFFFIGIVIVTLILAALVRVHPIFIPLFIMGWIIVIFLSGIFSNIYQEMAENPNLVAQASQLTFITGILEYLPFIIGVVGMLLMIVMYKAIPATE